MNRILCLILVFLGTATSMLAVKKQGVIKYDSRSNLTSHTAVFSEVYSKGEMDQWAKDRQSYEKWRLAFRFIPDTLSYKKLQQDSIAVYKAKYEVAKEYLDLNRSLMSLLGKPFQNDRQKSYVIELLKIISQRYKSDAKSIEKDLNKNKASKKLKIYLESVEKNSLLPSYNFASQDYDRIRFHWKDFFNSKKRVCPPMNYFTYTDTIENPYYDPIDEMIYGDGWDWYDKDNLNSQNESYPINIHYKYDPSHPEFRFKDCDTDSYHYVFDNQGNLIRVLLPNYRIWRQYFDVHSKNPVFKLLAQKAYEENEYDIKSEDTKTNHYVKNQLGLEELTAAEKKEQERRANAMANALVGAMRDGMKYGNNSKKGRAQQNKHAANFFGAMAGGSNNYYSDKGARWLSQIENDYWRFFNDRPPYIFERLDDTSFKVIYADPDGNPTLEFTYKYVQDKPYSVKEEVSLKKLFDGPASEYKP